jgi:hypothetical protein
VDAFPFRCVRKARPHHPPPINAAMIFARTDFVNVHCHLSVVLPATPASLCAGRAQARARSWRGVRLFARRATRTTTGDVQAKATQKMISSNLARRRSSLGASTNPSDFVSDVIRLKPRLSSSIFLQTGQNVRKRCAAVDALSSMKPLAIPETLSRAYARWKRASNDCRHASILKATAGIEY